MGEIMRAGRLARWFCNPMRRGFRLWVLLGDLLASKQTVIPWTWGRIQA